MDFGGLKVLMISSDRNILAPGSAVSERMKEYGKLVEELHIVLLSDASHKLKNTELAKNVWVYPTSSLASFLRPLGAAKIGKRVVFDRRFVRGNSVITADSIECGWAGIKIKNKWRIPLEVQIHSDPFSPFFTGFQNSVRKFFAKKVYTKADRIRVVSEQVGKKIGEYLERGKLPARRTRQAGKLKIYTLPIYVDIQQIEDSKVAFDLHARTGWQFIMLAVSRLAPEKDLPTAIRVLARVREQFPDTGLVIVGSGPEESKLKALAKELGVLKQVFFEGWQDSLASYYKTASVFIQTSLFEGFGMSLVEAALSGLPVVSTPVGVAAELEHGKEIYLCPAADVERFAGAVIDLLEQNGKRESMRLNLRHTLKSRLLSKDDYMANIKGNWEYVAKQAKE
ncbi:MAG: glycosyltransferase [bacterium]|nr:glycosyltransferase [bacterium]